ncbi:hypothetical protein SALBM311S_02842 [Streptomyces alboniger]
MRETRPSGPRRSLRRLVAVAFPALALTVAGFTAAPTAGAQPVATHPQTSKVTQNDKALTAPARQTYHSTGKAGQKVPTQHLCATAQPGQASCFAQRRTDIKQRLASRSRCSRALRPRPRPTCTAPTTCPPRPVRV